MNNPANYHTINHPLLMEKLSHLMDECTSSPDFRRLTQEISFLLTYEALRDWVTEETKISTPNGTAVTPTLINHPTVVSVLRGGNGMLPGVLEALPLAHVGHIGIYRDRELNSTIEYFLRLPDNAQDKPVLLLDPVIATGDTICASVSRLRKFGISDIRILTILASEVGLKKLNATDDTVSVWGLRLAESLNQSGHLAPGPGDVSARFFNAS